MTTTTPTTIQNIRLFLITPSPLNPRKTIDEDSLKELAANIEKQGLLQPITVRPVSPASSRPSPLPPPPFSSVPSFVHSPLSSPLSSIPPAESRDGRAPYEIVCGERRYRACSLLHWETIPCIIRPMTDEEALDAMITENLQRRDVDPVEEAEAFRILSQRGQTVDDLAARFGKSTAYIRDRMKLTSLIQPLQKALSHQQLTLRGAVLLSRLSDDDQKQFIKRELERGHDIADSDKQLSTGYVEEWLDRFFRNLHKAPFQDGETLDEAWNPEGIHIRRCDRCDCNTNNHGCLFADMKLTEPQCTDERCYNRKTDIYYDCIIQQLDARIVREGKHPAPGQVIIVDGEPYSQEAKERRSQWLTKIKCYGYRLFTAKETDIYYGTPEKLLGKGELIEGISIYNISQAYHDPIRYYRLHSATVPGASAQGNLPARLAERAATIAQKTETKVANYAKKNFDKDAYIADDSILNEWEKTIVWAIIFEAVDYLDRVTLIPETKYNTPTIQQIRSFRDRQKTVRLTEHTYGPSNAWMRRAIANWAKKSYHESFLEELLKQSSTEHYAHIAEFRDDARTRIDSISQELHDMGYDENANPL